MKAICLTDPSDASSLVEVDVPQPQPGADEVLVRVNAAGITPSELLWFPTSHNRDGSVRANAIPGHEFSGVMAGMGESVRGVELGAEVYGLNDWFADGAMSEFCVTRPASIAPKPSILSHIEAASVPISALTAWQGLFDRADVQAGEHVLVQGGSGAVGVYAVQLARYRGARVSATTSAAQAEFVRQLGAGETIDYRGERFEDRVHEIDVVFDTVGGETLERSWAVLRPGGRMVTIAAGNEASSERSKQAFFIVEPNRDQLIEITRLFNDGHLRTVVDAVVPLAEVPSAYRGQARSRTGRGKMVAAV